MEDCIKGDHKLEEITILTHWDGSSQVVRWCSVCGAIVIDTDIDSRIFPGQGMEMKFPKITKDFHEEYEKRKKETSTCSKCGVETPFVMTIDNWAIIDGEEYCRKCQKKYKVGWSDPNNK